MRVHMDGARIANACAALRLSLKELTVDCGIDVLSFGGTKNGLMMGECVVIFDDALKEEARFIRPTGFEDALSLLPVHRLSHG